jgi:hypothetical protein
MRPGIGVGAVVTVFVATLGLAVGRAEEPPARVARAEVPRGLGSFVFEFSQAEFTRIIRGYQINPVPLDLKGKNAALVGLGSYLVNAAGGCNDCHTSPPYAEGGDPFLGQPKQVNTARFLAGGTPFGPFVSRNLTPRASTGLPAGLTLEQFRVTMRTGADLKHRPPHVPSEERDLLQVMPWPVFQDLSDRDLRAIYEYLRAIPSLPSAP